MAQEAKAAGKAGGQADVGPDFWKVKREKECKSHEHGNPADV